MHLSDEKLNKTQSTQSMFGWRELFVQGLWCQNPGSKLCYVQALHTNDSPSARVSLGWVGEVVLRLCV